MLTKAIPRRCGPICWRAWAWVLHDGNLRGRVIDTFVTSLSRSERVDWSPMPARKRPKAVPPPPPVPLSAEERFAQAVRETEQAKRSAAQAATERKNEATRMAKAAAEHAAAMKRAQSTHVHAVANLKSAKQNHKGITEAELAWRSAKADLLELETGERPEWAPIVAQEPQPEPVTDIEEPALEQPEVTA